MKKHPQEEVKEDKVSFNTSKSCYGFLEEENSKEENIELPAYTNFFHPRTARSTEHSPSKTTWIKKIKDQIFSPKKAVIKQVEHNSEAFLSCVDDMSDQGSDKEIEDVVWFSPPSTYARTMILDYRGEIILDHEGTLTKTLTAIKIREFDKMQPIQIAEFEEVPLTGNNFDE